MSPGRACQRSLEIQTRTWAAPGSDSGHQTQVTSKPQETQELATHNN